VIARSDAKGPGSGGRLTFKRNVLAWTPRWSRPDVIGLLNEAGVGLSRGCSQFATPTIPSMFRNCNMTCANRGRNWIRLEDVCIRGEAIIQNSKFTRKLSLQPKSFPGLGRARVKGIRVFSVFCLRLRAGYVQRVETIRLSSVSDPKKKIASVRESTISPVIASSRRLPRSRCSRGLDCRLP
jgi:hypothetical protein